MRGLTGLSNPLGALPAQPRGCVRPTRLWSAFDEAGGAMDRVRVGLGERSYDVIVGAGSMACAGDLLGAVWRGGPVARIADRRVWGLHGDEVQRGLGLAANGAVLTVPPGERSKSWNTAGRLLRELASGGMARDGLVVAVGGGVTGDIAGFVAATYARGVDLVQVPTTLLAQVDSSVGGKTGVNLPNGKNLVGAFHQPRLVVCDPAFLATLPRREIRCGLAEALKHGFVADAAYLERVESLCLEALRAEPDALTAIVVGSCEIKARIVMADEQETGLRAVLNFGHTIGHAVEKVGGYRRYRHGEAVAIGMVGAAALGARIGTCSGAVASRVRAALAQAGLPTSAPGLDREALLAALAVDKKVARGKVRWVLPVEVGKVIVTADVSRRAITATLDDLVGGRTDP